MAQAKRGSNVMQYAAVELGGLRYAIVPESAMVAVCRRAGMDALPAGVAVWSLVDVPGPNELDGVRVARRIADRRKQAGLTQGELARRAGVRVETVNRIERGHVTPDFGTIRKLVEAMAKADSAARGL